MSFGKNIGLSSKYSQKTLDHAKQSVTYALKTTSKVAANLFGNKIAGNITKSQELYHKTV